LFCFLFGFLSVVITVAYCFFYGFKYFGFVFLVGPIFFLQLLNLETTPGNTPGNTPGQHQATRRNTQGQATRATPGNTPGNQGPHLTPGNQGHTGQHRDNTRQRQGQAQ